MFGLIMINAGLLLQVVDKLYGYLKSVSGLNNVSETPSAKVEKEDLDGPTHNGPNITAGASASAPVPGQPNKTTEKEESFCWVEPGFFMPKMEVTNTEDASEVSETPSDLDGQDSPGEAPQATSEGGATSSAVVPFVPQARPARLTRRQLLLAKWQVCPVLMLDHVPGTNRYYVRPITDGSQEASGEEARNLLRDMIIARRAWAAGGLYT
ncbi:uncharacterized protein LOC118408111 [Branchiostoma floridae]|uniref:Uncharacterized protein LOC118408111 n=1 Tax=Branchiostoma floridae TaxID=7739 RepID=A0A9J7KBV5_BRAFL|nr:uncharacterized protein LOC118408111 [Branchiostoma floridae]